MRDRQVIAVAHNNSINTCVWTDLCESGRIISYVVCGAEIDHPRC